MPRAKRPISPASVEYNAPRLASRHSAQKMSVTRAKPTFRDKMDACLNEQDHYEEKANLKRFLTNRAAGKRMYTVNGGETVGKLFWLTEDDADKRRGDGLLVEEALVDYHTEDWKCGESWKTASQDAIEALIAQSKRVILHNC